MSDLIKTFAENVRRERRLKECSQQTLADMSGMHVNHLGQIERAQKMPSLFVSLKIAMALNTTIDELLKEK